MTKEAIARQFFMDFLENLGERVDCYEEFEEEECNMILTDLFFAGQLEVGWNPETNTLMLKPAIICNVKE
jgi:hypothetical protein